jgi:hypothetical protein
LHLDPSQGAGHNDVVDGLLAADPGARVVVIGDFNEFSFVSPIDVLKGGVLTDLVETLPEVERYSFIFDGNSQELDHLLVTDALTGGSDDTLIGGFQYDIVHANTEFADGATDHDPGLGRFHIAEAHQGDLRAATFNASLNRNSEGQLVQDLSTPNNAQAKTVAEIIQRVNPDLLLINEFDFVPNNVAVDLFRDNYLEVSQNGLVPVAYPFVFVAPSNTGIPSGFDLDNNGSIGGGNDAFGFGNFPGQFGMAFFSKYEILVDEVRTFQTFLWKDMPGALLPDNAATTAPNDFYSPEELAVFRLASKSHWDVPVLFGGIGNDVLVGGTGNDELFGEAGNDILNGGTGNDLIVGGEGNDDMTGGTGSDVFEFGANSGVDIVRDFRVNQDKLALGDLFSDFDDFLNNGGAITAAGRDTLITLGGGNQVTLLGVRATTVDADDFTFTV